MEERAGMAIHFDKVHIITVNYTRKEARLYENGGATEGTLIIKGEDAGVKAPLDDPMKLFEMALSYGVSYELLSKVASPHALKVFEMLGVKALIDKVVGMTTERERHQRFEGFEFSFGATASNGNGSSKPTPPAASTPPKHQTPVSEPDGNNKRKGNKVPTT